jgi:hypothetical protein
MNTFWKSVTLVLLVVLFIMFFWRTIIGLVVLGAIVYLGFGILTSKKNRNGGSS